MHYGIDLNDYEHIFPAKRVLARLDEDGNVMTANDGSVLLDSGNNSSAVKPIDVYSFDSLLDIEVFLTRRAQAYRYVYFSERMQIRDSIMGEFLKAVIGADEDTRPDDPKNNLKSFINLLRNEKGNIDLDTYLSWNNITFYNACLDVAERNAGKPLEELVGLVIQNFYALEDFISYYLGKINKNTIGIVEPTDEDRAFIERVERLKSGETNLKDILNDLGYFDDNCLCCSENESGNCWITSNQSIYAYNPDVPIYVMGKDGKKIYTLDKHPNTVIEWWNEKQTVKEVRVRYTTTPMLRFEEMPEDRIEGLKARYSHKVPKLQFESNRNYGNRDGERE